MRGKAFAPSGILTMTRITPAYAGKSGLRSKVERNDGDHPRLCGEKDKQFLVKWLLTGSPPPMRGKAASLYVPYVGIGITPAYAGKSKEWQTVKGYYRDHPRLCGEKALHTVGIT